MGVFLFGIIEEEYKCFLTLLNSDTYKISKQKEKSLTEPLNGQ